MVSTGRSGTVLILGLSPPWTQRMLPSTMAMMGKWSNKDPKVFQSRMV
jgi:hypothetical protein